MLLKITFSINLLLFLLSPISLFSQINIDNLNKNAQTNFAVSEIQTALKTNAPKTNFKEIIIVADSVSLLSTAKKYQLPKPVNFGWQSFSIRVNENKIFVLASEPSGAMYGALEVAQHIKNGTINQIKNSDNQPYLKRRGVKFNIPLDLRTPSYSDISTISQANMKDVWDLNFWKDYFDEMARKKFNVMTWWTLNPFPSMVNVPEFPDVSLSDVWRTKAPLDDNFSERGLNFVRPEMLQNHEVIKKISTQQKVKYWQQVMQCAKDRGIEIYIYIWNIYPNAANGKYGINNKQNNEQTIKYYRYATREMVKTYPLLKGIGITAGEGMERIKGEYSDEKWLWKTYGEGISDALKLDPKKNFTLIHRFHQTSYADIKEAFANYPSTFQVCFKYAIAHMYSIPNPPFTLSSFALVNKDLQTWVTLRNDDIYNMRWANIDYARSFIKAIPKPENVVGFNLGPDGYLWGRDYIARNSDGKELVFSKQWASNMLWGELGYNPDKADSILTKNITSRFKNLNNEKLMKAWAAASMVFPLTTRFCWGDIDLKWFPEANFSNKSRFSYWDILDYVKVKPMPGSHIRDIVSWTTLYHTNQKDSLISPLAAADSIAKQASIALFTLKDLGSYDIKGISESDKTLSDIEAFGHIGNFYANKIKAAAYISLYNKYQQENQQQQALFFINQALADWKKYAAIHHAKYQPALYNRVGFVDLIALTKEVEKDVDMIKNWKFEK